MKLRSFAGLVGPSVLALLALLSVLSVRNCVLQMELVTVQQTGPVGAHQVTTQRAQVDASGKAVQLCRWVGLDCYRTVLGLDSYHVLLQESNPYKASAASVLTIIGIALLLIPLLRKTWRKQRQGG